MSIEADKLGHMMKLKIDVGLHYTLPGTTDLLLQIEAAQRSDQSIVHHHMSLSASSHKGRVRAQDGIGERIWLCMDRHFQCHYQAEIEINRPKVDIATLKATPTHLLPEDAVRYLMPSRYCPSDEFQSFVNAELSAKQGGARIAAIKNWIEAKIAYVSGASGSHTTAADTFLQRQGVCRDFAHVMIAFARASAIPARFVSCYAPRVSPQDFHAVVEVYLEGAWHLVDATGMSEPEEIACIGVGLDAAEVAFINSFGPIWFQSQTVSVTQS